MVKERLKSLVGRVYFLNAENLLAAFIYYPLKNLTSTSEVNLPVKLLWITVDPFPTHTSECPLSMAISMTFRLDPKPKRHPIEHIGRIAQHPSGGDLPPIELAAPWEAQLLLAAHLPRLKEAVPIPSHPAQRALRGHASVALI